MKNKVYKVVGIIALFLALQAAPVVLAAQCPMCKIAAESNLKNGGSAGKGLNGGILYMLATPYIIVGTIGYLWWRNRKKEKELETEASLRSSEQPFEV